MRRRSKDHSVIRESAPVSPASERPDAQRTSAILVKFYGDAARAEALLRAFLAEHHRDTPDARFWLEVYGLIGGTRRK